MIKAEYIDHMGDDLRVVNAARVSFDKESQWYVPEDAQRMGYSVSLKLNEKDKRLINYLAKHNHWTPFSHVMVTMRETVPIFVARQRFKHMVGFTYNEVSRRYVDVPPEFYVPDAWRKKAENVKQGSSEETIHLLDGRLDVLPDQGDQYQDYEDIVILCKRWYENAIELGVCAEQARMVLPQAMMTSYYVTGSLAAWARAYKQRIDPHAQKEIRDLAVQWGDIIEPLFPVSWEALSTIKEETDIEKQ